MCLFIADYVVAMTLLLMVCAKLKQKEGVPTFDTPSFCFTPIPSDQKFHFNGSK
jgi:hypothetical protein